MKLSFEEHVTDGDDPFFDSRIQSAQGVVKLVSWLRAQDIPKLMDLVNSTNRGFDENRAVSPKKFAGYVEHVKRALAAIDKLGLQYDELTHQPRDGIVTKYLKMVEEAIGSTDVDRPVGDTERDEIRVWASDNLIEPIKEPMEKLIEIRKQVILAGKSEEVEEQLDFRLERLRTQVIDAAVKLKLLRDDPGQYDPRLVAALSDSLEKFCADDYHPLLQELKEMVR